MITYWRTVRIKRADLVHVLTEGTVISESVRVVHGLPDGAVLKGIYYNDGADEVVAYFEHPDFRSNAPLPLQYELFRLEEVDDGGQTNLDGGGDV